MSESRISAGIARIVIDTYEAIVRVGDTFFKNVIPRLVNSEAVRHAMATMRRILKNNDDTAKSFYRSGANAWAKDYEVAQQ